MGFERVSTEAILKGKVRKEFAWKIISDYKKYEEIMENVDQVVILENDGNEGKSEWFITIEEAPLRWIEHDYFDIDNYEIRFESIDGDFENINGKWKVENYQNEGIKIYFQIDYNLGIPVIEEVLGHILKEKMKTNIDSMIHAIKEELTKSQEDDRRFPRINIGRYSNIILNDNNVRAYIVNLSQKGMMFYYDGEFDASNIILKIDDITIRAESLFNDLKHKNSRIIFKEPISLNQMEYLKNKFMLGATRAYERHVIEKNAKIASGDTEYNVHIHNISPKGIFFKYYDTFEIHKDKIKIAGIELYVKEIHHDVGIKSVRIEFKSPINEKDYDKILSEIKDNNSKTQ